MVRFSLLVYCGMLLVGTDIRADDDVPMGSLLPVAPDNSRQFALRFLTEDRIPDWAAVAENRVRRELTEALAEELREAKVECRLSLCRARIVFSESERLRPLLLEGAFYTGLAERSGFEVIATTGLPYAEEVRTLILYFAGVVSLAQ